MNKKAEGYTVVAAEQTSNSTMIQKFKFPKKTLLLLGYVIFVGDIYCHYNSKYSNVIYQEIIVIIIIIIIQDQLSYI